MPLTLNARTNWVLAAASWAGARSLAQDMPLSQVLLEGEGWEVIPVGVSEFAKVEGGVTCLSLVFEAPPASETTSAFPWGG